MTLSVADRVKHRLPRPIKCDDCGSPRVALQKRSYMKLRTYRAWDLIWHCEDCRANVGCHEGTDIPFGLMADAQTRDARWQCHREFDALWKGRTKVMCRDDAYAWMAVALSIPIERAHIGMLNERQCEAIMEGIKKFRHDVANGRHWKQKTRKRRRT